MQLQYAMGILNYTNNFSVGNKQSSQFLPGLNPSTNVSLYTNGTVRPRRRSSRLQQTAQAG
jgi:hypothetical protein